MSRERRKEAKKRKDVDAGIRKARFSSSTLRKVAGRTKVGVKDSTWAHGD